MNAFKSIVLGLGVCAGLMAMPSLSWAGYASTVCSSGLSRIDAQMNVYLANPVPQNALYITMALNEYPQGCSHYKDNMGTRVGQLTANADKALAVFASAPSKESVAAVIAMVSQLKPFDVASIYDNELDKMKVALATFTGKDMTSEQLALINPAFLPAGDRTVMSAFKQSYVVASTTLDKNMAIAANHVGKINTQS